MKKYTFLNEFFGFNGKNTITSEQFNNIVKICIIDYLKNCIKIMSKYDGTDDWASDEWWDECINLLDIHLKKCSAILKKNGLNKFNYNKLCDDIGDSFESNLKYCLVTQSNKNWINDSTKDILKQIKKLSNPKVQIYENNTIIREYGLQS